MTDLTWAITETEPRHTQWNHPTQSWGELFDKHRLIGLIMRLQAPLPFAPQDVLIEQRLRCVPHKVRKEDGKHSEREFRVPAQGQLRQREQQ